MSSDPWARGLPMQLVECVANISEGRDAEVVQRVAESCSAADQSWLLDVSSDVDHHRSVITFAARPEAVLDACLSLIGEAVRRIDLRRHQGVHPRIGAADVIPLVPLRGVLLDQCVTLARKLARRTAEAHRLPVYLYGAAAQRPDRRFLASIRRGGFEGLSEEISAQAGRRPDFGPDRVHASAGAVCIGARPLLIAFNVYLEGGDVETARAIAARVRTRDGGLPGVQALGLHIAVRDQAQVSMNLYDFAQTSPRAAFDEVRRLARQRGADTHSSELVGLIPAAALAEGDAEHMILRDFTPSRVLETRVAEVILAERP
ncbi:MAG TPA: glutamate formimidoyltransferase [Acidobacteriota bacterium]|nr:glutamate formimidoyltransferase [Acidobacteriota bacterium]